MFTTSCYSRENPVCWRHVCQRRVVWRHTQWVQVSLYGGLHWWQVSTRSVVTVVVVIVVVVVDVVVSLLLGVYTYRSFHVSTSQRCSLFIVCNVVVCLYYTQRCFGSILINVVVCLWLSMLSCVCTCQSSFVSILVKTFGGCCCQRYRVSILVNVVLRLYLSTSLYISPGRCHLV